MSRHQQRFTGAAGQFQQQTEDAFAGIFVEVAGRFIGQDEQRVMDQRAGNGDPLLFAAAQLVGIGGETVGQPHAVQERFGLSLNALVTTSEFQWQGDIFQHRERGDQVEELKDNANMAATEEGALLFTQGGDPDFLPTVVNHHMAAAGGVDAGDEVE